MWGVTNGGCLAEVHFSPDVSVGHTMYTDQPADNQYQITCNRMSPVQLLLAIEQIHRSIRRVKSF